jgi:peptidoglycan hydrolase CwlO-like protein
MQVMKRFILIMLTLVLCGSSSLMAHAQTNTEALQNIQKKLVQQAQDKEAVNKEIASIQQEMQSLYTYISNNKEAMAKTQEKIAATNQLIEEKKANIVTLEDKMSARKDVMKQRLVALQHDNNLTLVIKVILESKSFDDLIQRASAVSALFSADKDILTGQENDLKQIEKDKKEIDRQEQVLQEEQQNLVKQQAELDQNLQKRQAGLTELQQKYTQISQQMAATQQEKAGVEAQIKAAQEELRRQQEAAAAAAKARATASSNSVASTQSTPAPAGKGEEMYVTATAYSWESSGTTTKLGYNIKTNPNIKLIAVDSSVIPLGKTVWVEGYGVAIAGDTGGAIVGHRIDLVMPSNAQCIAYGRKTVKVIILN